MSAYRFDFGPASICSKPAFDPVQCGSKAGVAHVIIKFEKKFEWTKIEMTSPSIFLTGPKKLDLGVLDRPG